MKLTKGQTLTIVLSGGADCNTSVSWAVEAQPSLGGTVNQNFTALTTGTDLLAGRSDMSQVRTVETITVRNVDVTSNDVTIKLNDGTTNSEIYKVTLAAGSQAVYAHNVGWVVSTTTPTGATLYTATADVVNSAADTLANLTGLTHTVEAGDKYRFRAVCHFAADATTSGSRWSINGPAATAASTGYRSNYSLTATTETVNAGLAAVQLPAAANATSAATTGNIAIIEGYYTPSTAGTFAIQFAAEAGTITAKAGSTLEIMKVIDA